MGEVNIGVTEKPFAIEILPILSVVIVFVFPKPVIATEPGFDIVPVETSKKSEFADPFAKLNWVDNCFLLIR